jgi:hypothetical protein
MTHVSQFIPEATNRIIVTEEISGWPLYSKRGVDFYYF